MAHLNQTGTFQQWELTDEERINGTILTITQKQCIQNQVANLGIEILNMIMDPQNPMAYALQKAEKQGQILALNYLLTLSSSAEAERGEPTAKHI